MIITRIEITNVRGFRDLKVDFGTTGASVLITGDNGDGKTTVLRALAMGLCDTLGASGLLTELPGEFIMYDKRNAKIIVYLQTVHHVPRRFRITTTIEQDANKTTETVSQKYERQPNKKRPDEWCEVKDDFPWNEVFGAAYGAGLRFIGNERYEHYYLTDAVYSLFNTNANLQEQELVYRRILDHARSKDPEQGGKHAEEMLTNTLRQLLNLPPGMNIALRETGIFFALKNGGTELASMGDGIQSIVTLVLDLMSWWYLHLSDIDKLKVSDTHDTTQIYGIVLIDEVEKHLHPSWQRRIISGLLNTFPNIQFVMSTHAPLCVSGATDLDTEKLFLLRTKKEEDAITGYRYELPKGYRADEVLTSEAFGLETSVSPAVERLVTVITQLMELQTRTREQEDKLDSLLEKLNQVSPLSAERQRDQVGQLRLASLLESELLSGEPKASRKQ